jgi:TPR repeat protein
MHEEGVGVAKDKARALDLYAKACTGGDLKGCVYADVLRRKLGR